MLLRIVRMTFRPEGVEPFLDQFSETAPKIRSFQGCHHLELWRDEDTPTVFTTYSQWSSKEALDTYRESDLFRNTWTTVQSLFADRPEAHSYTVERSAATIEEAIQTGPRSET